MKEEKMDLLEEYNKFLKTLRPKRRPSHGQVYAIKMIEHTLGIGFDGKTRNEAKAFLTRYMEVSKQVNDEGRKRHGNNRQ